MDVHFLTGGQIHPDWENTHEWISVPLEPGKDLALLLIFSPRHLNLEYVKEEADCL